MVNTAKEQAEAAAFNALPREMILGIQQRIDERNRQKLNAQTGNILVPTRYDMLCTADSCGSVKRYMKMDHNVSI